MQIRERLKTKNKATPDYNIGVLEHLQVLPSSGRLLKSPTPPKHLFFFFFLHGLCVQLSQNRTLVLMSQKEINTTRKTTSDLVIGIL